MAAMATEPTIEEILASLDRLLEDSDFAGNDDAGIAAAESEELPESQEEDVPLDAATVEYEIADDEDISLDDLFLDSDEDAPEPLEALASAEAEEDVDDADASASEVTDADIAVEISEQSDAAMPAPVDDGAIEFAEDEFPQDPFESAVMESEENDVADPFEEDMAAAVHHYARNAAEADAPAAAESTDIEEEATFPDEVDESALVQEEADVEMLPEPEVNSVALDEPASGASEQAVEATAEWADADIGDEQDGSSDEDACVEDEEMYADAGDDASDTSDASDVPDVPEPEESRPVILLTAADALDAEEVEQDEPAPADALPLQLPVAPQPEVPKPAGVMLLTEAMLIEDHQSALPFDHPPASKAGKNDRADAAAKPAPDAVRANTAPTSMDDDVLPVNMPEAWQELISDRIARRIEDILPALVEASVARAMKKAKKQAKRKIKNSKL